jgi:cytochrome c oxidase cbb3-type subunit 3
VNLRVLPGLALLCLLAGCRREKRILHVDAPETDRRQNVRVSSLEPGPQASDSSAPPDSSMPAIDTALHFAEMAYTLNTGKQLFSQMNCVGCHAHGGGGMGPALMDSVWIYGNAPSQLFATISQGRPNGMPAFGRRIPSYQIWELVAYVRSMSGLAPFTAAPGRSDQMFPGQPENSRERPERPPVRLPVP